MGLSSCSKPQPTTHLTDARSPHAHARPRDGNTSSILLHPRCITRMCFKRSSAVELIRADSYIKRRALCVSGVIRYASIRVLPALGLCVISLPLRPDSFSRLLSFLLFVVVLPVWVQKCPQRGSGVHSLRGSEGGRMRLFIPLFFITGFFCLFHHV